MKNKSSVTSGCIPPMVACNWQLYKCTVKLHIKSPDYQGVFISEMS